MNSQYNRYKPLAHWPVGTSGGKENAPPPISAPSLLSPKTWAPGEGGCSCRRTGRDTEEAFR